VVCDRYRHRFGRGVLDGAQGSRCATVFGAHNCTGPDGWCDTGTGGDAGSHNDPPRSNRRSVSKFTDRWSRALMLGQGPFFSGAKTRSDGAHRGSGQQAARVTAI
jgi:hypothetical protein